MADKEKDKGDKADKAERAAKVDKSPEAAARAEKAQAAKAKGPMKAANRPRITNGLVLNVTMRWVLPVASQPYTLGDGGLSQRPWGAWCRLRCGWNLTRRVLRSHEGIVSGCEVNWLIDGLCGERLPAIDFAHIDLA